MSEVAFTVQDSRTGKVKTVRMSPTEMVERLKDKVRWMSGPPAIRFADEGSNNHGAVLVIDGENVEFENGHTLTSYGVKEGSQLVILYALG